MSEREQSPADARPAGEHQDRSSGADWRDSTTPGIEPVGTSAAGGATAAPGGRVGGHGVAESGENYYTAPQYSTAPVSVRRADKLAGLLLVLAGIAAAVSLLLDWVTGDDRSGWDLVGRGFDELGQGFGTLLDSGFWQPLAVVLGGGVLLLLGLLMFVPARTHRFFGVLALVVALVATAGVLVALAGAGWDTARFDVGMWFGVAVAGLGLLGALKAMLTGPKLATAPPAG